MTRLEISDLVAALGDIITVLTHADPADKAEIYTQLGLHLTYEPGAHRVIAKTKPKRSCTKGTCPRGESTRNPTRVCASG